MSTPIRLPAVTAPWMLAVLAGAALECLFALLSLAFNGTLHLPLATLFVLTILVAIGLPVMLVGLILAAPLMHLARAGALPRPLADCGIGAGLALLALTGAHLLFSPNKGWAQGVFGPIWVDAMCALTSGAIGGAVYWLLAGKPRPPYRAAEPPSDEA